MLQPTFDLLEFFKEREIRATFFVEVLELMAMEETVQAGRGGPSLAEDLAEVREQWTAPSGFTG